MKSIVLTACWSVSVLALVYLAIGAEEAALMDRPMAALGLGLIGLGLCLHVRRRPVPAAAE